MLRPFSWTVPTRVLHAPDGGAATAAALVGSATAVVVCDAAVGGYGAALAARSSAPVITAPAHCRFDDLRRLSDALREHRAEVVLAVGGGTVLDLARLASLTIGQPALASPEGWSGTGLRRRRQPAEFASPKVIALPSTTGTGAEVSALAVIATDADPLRMVVADAGLQPAAAILDVALLRSLPVAVVRDGLLEAAGRILGPALADDGANATADEIAAALLRRILALSSEIPGAEMPGSESATGTTPVKDAVLAEAAWISTLCATQLASVGRTVADSPLWLMQHAVTGRRPGTTKAMALRSLLPLLLNRVADDRSAAPVLTGPACRRLAELIAGPGADLLATLQAGTLLRGPCAEIDPGAHGADLVSQGFTAVGGLQGHDADWLAHLLTPGCPSQPSTPNGSK